jgi:hypothetical protein
LWPRRLGLLVDLLNGLIDYHASVFVHRRRLVSEQRNGSDEHGKERVEISRGFRNEKLFGDLGQTWQFAGDR